MKEDAPVDAAWILVAMWEWRISWRDERASGESECAESSPEGREMGSADEEVPMAARMMSVMLVQNFILWLVVLGR